jgi:hypothetical protein
MGFGQLILGMTEKSCIVASCVHIMLTITAVFLPICPLLAHFGQYKSGRELLLISFYFFVLRLFTL